MQKIWIEDNVSEIVDYAVKYGRFDLVSSQTPSAVKDCIKFELDKSPILSKESYKVVKTKSGHNSVVCRNSADMAYALMDLAEGKIDFKKSYSFTPALATRAYQMWLPFALGQAYGGEGYSFREYRTDWWWYDRNFWLSFLQELAIGRCNMIVIWHTHPHSLLIEYEKYPEAAYFLPKRQVKNIEQFDWIVKTAKKYGIDIVIMQYNIHVSPGFAKAHNLGSIKAEAGFGGTDSKLIRDYNRYCLEQLFATYPDLAGLMICGELNKDAFGFINDVILPPIMESGSESKLHFRLWGQHFPDEVRKLAIKCPNRFVLWHKITQELISVPKADSRIEKWHKEFPDIPFCAIAGPGQAAGHRYQGRVFIDPEFVATQIKDLVKKGGTGIGLFCGMDNWCTEKDGLKDHEEALDIWYSANWLSRQITPRLAWRPDDCDAAFWTKKIAKHYDIPQPKAKQVLSCGITASKVYPELSTIVGQYGQDLGFLGMLGMWSLQTMADKGGNFRLAGPYAYPFHNWGIKQPDIMQIAQSLDQTNKYLKLADALETNSIKALKTNLKVATASRLIDYIKLECLIGVFYTNIFKAALCAYRVPFSYNYNESIKFLEKTITYLTRSYKTGQQIGKFSQSIPVIPIEIRWDLPTPMRLGKDWLKNVDNEKKTFVKIFNNLKKNKKLYSIAKLYWQSHCHYHDVLRWLPMNGYHLDNANILKASKLLSSVYKLAKTTKNESWTKFIEVEIERLKPLTMNVPYYSPELLHELDQKVSYLADYCKSPCIFSRSLLSYFEPDAVNLMPRNICDSRAFKLLYDRHDLILLIQASVKDDISLILVNQDPQTSLRLKIDIVNSSAERTICTLRPLHGMAFSEPVKNKIKIKPTEAKGHFLIRIPFAVIGKKPKSADQWGFNLFIDKPQRTWSPVTGLFNWLDPPQAGKIIFS